MRELYLARSTSVCVCVCKCVCKINLCSHTHGRHTVLTCVQSNSRSCLSILSSLSSNIVISLALA
jgi:hypothetical protein